MVYADYPYYVDCFLGNVIPPDDFPRMAKRASAAIDNLTRNRAATYYAGVEAHPVGDATCAVAEVLYRFDLAKSAQVVGQDLSGKDITATILSESNDGYSVSYAKPIDPDSKEGREAMTAQVYDAAAEYLAWTGLLYSGVGMI